MSQAQNAGLIPGPSADSCSSRTATPRLSWGSGVEAWVSGSSSFLSLPRVNVQQGWEPPSSVSSLQLSIFEGICAQRHCRIAGEERCQFGATQHGAQPLPASITPPGEVILPKRFPWWLPQGPDHSFLVQPRGSSHLERRVLSPLDEMLLTTSILSWKAGLSGLQ